MKTLEKIEANTYLAFIWSCLICGMLIAGIIQIIMRLDKIVENTTPTPIEQVEQTGE